VIDTAAHLGAMKKAAMKASKILMRRYGKLKRKQIISKSLNDFVTVVDKDAQSCIVKSLKQSFPKYGFWAEEEELYEEKDWMWVIDPLDGTSNYIHQFPLFCISIGLIHKSVPCAGLIMDPIHDEIFSAFKGKGAFLNGKRISVSNISGLKKAFIATGFPFRAKKHFEPYHESFKDIFYRSSGIRRGGSAALDLCYVACGRVDGFWELGLSAWDVAAGIVIIEEAGGKLSNFGGRKHHLESGNIVAGNPFIQRDLVRCLKRIPEFGKIF
jgi:myo-inositol-1(or 4)-monophosphatase